MTNPPPTIHVLIDYSEGYGGPRPWRWEIIDTLVAMDDGTNSTYEEACDAATAVVRRSIHPHAVIAYHHTFQALLREHEPRPVSWVVST